MEEQEDFSAIRFIRMNTGEDLISEVVEVEENDIHYFTLINPLKLIYMSGVKPGVLTISMMQWVFPRISKEQEFNIHPETVITMTDAADNMIEYYHKTLEHFDNMKTDVISYHDGNYSVEEDFDSDTSTDDVMDMLKELLNTKDTKKLH